MADDNLSPPKTTPARRRNGRNGSRPAGQKAYASENDVPSFAASRHHRMPQTPDKSGPASSAPANANVVQGGSKQRNRNTKSKAKNLPTSPDSGLRNDYSPQRSPTTKPRSSTAYAGATFHASPAPSALPIPSFLAKSSSESPITRDPKGIIQEPSPPATDTDAPTPYRPSSMPRNHESPLDFMFRAHREERERHRQETAISLAPNAPGTSSPSHSIDPCHSPSVSTLSQTRRSCTRQSFGGIDSFELDGSPGQPMGPAFSTPYQDRIKAARSNTSRTVPHQEGPEQTSHAIEEDPTEALKKFLFGGAPPSSTSLPTPTAASIPYVPTSGTTSLANNQVDGSSYARMNSLQAMENDLRRILKLDLAPDSSSTERRLFTR